MKGKGSGVGERGGEGRGALLWLIDIEVKQNYIEKSRVIYSFYAIQTSLFFVLCRRNISRQEE